MFIHTLYKRKSKDEYKKMFYSNYNTMNLMNMNMGYGNFNNPFMSMMGGYGMSPYSFGSFMMPSVFSFGGYGMYGGCGCNSMDDSAFNAMLGYGLTTTLLGAGAMIYASNARSKAENSTENKLAQNEQSTQNLLGKLDKNATEDNYQNYVNNAKSDMETAKATLDKYNKDTNSIADTTINTSKAKIAELRTKLSSKDIDETERTQIREQIANLQKDIEDAQALKRDYAEAQKAYTNAKNKYDNFNSIGQQIAALKTEKIALEKQLKKEADAKTLDKADGSFLTRTTEKSFKNMYDFDLDCDNKFAYKDVQNKIHYTAADLSDRDVRYLINKYKDGNLNDKRQVKAFFVRYNDEINDSAKKGSNQSGIDLILKANLG